MAEMTGVFAFRQCIGILKSTDGKASDPRELKGHDSLPPVCILQNVPRFRGMEHLVATGRY